MSPGSFSACNGASVLSPADGVSCHHLLPQALAAEGLVYLRLTRPKRPLLYDPRDRDFPIGGSRLLRESGDDRAAVIATGVCVHEALTAADRLAADGIALRVIDAYSIQPLDVHGIAGAATDTGHLITVEDHYRAGGLGEAVAAQVLPRTRGVAFTSLAVDGVPRSGDAAVLMQRHGIDAEAIERAVRTAIA